MNSISRTPLRVRHQPRLRIAQVVAVETISPRMRRITFGGAELAGFSSAAADDHVKLFFPAKGQDLPILPTLGPDGPVVPDGSPRPIARDYTPRRFLADQSELVIEFVLHGDGPASEWAAQARPGQTLGIGGPRGSLLIPDDYDAYLLAGDETALPAIARRLEELPAGVSAFVVIEVADAREERYLPTSANARILWRYRNGAPDGTPDLLEDAITSIPLPQGDTHAWIAGEIEVARRLRSVLIAARGFSRDQVKAAGYWRRGEAGAHARIDD